MNTPQLGDSITLTEANRDQVILFVRKCSDWVSAFKPHTDDEPPAVDPNATYILVEGIYTPTVRVEIDDTVVRTGENQITIQGALGGTVVLDLDH